MLNPEEAKSRLREFRAPNSADERLARIGTLSQQAQKIALALLNTDQDREGWRAFAAATHDLASLDATGIRGVFTAIFPRLLGRQAAPNLQPGRLAVFTAIFPRLGEDLEAAWQFHEGLPYGRGNERPPFHAPGAPELTHIARVDWLSSFIRYFKDYDRDVLWYAEWAAHLNDRGHALGVLFAAAIDSGSARGQAVYETLIASARGEHPVGLMGGHVVQALLAASRPDGWELVENLLVGAQREEGLRETILKSLLTAHPTAFRRMLRCILVNDLVRFPVVVDVVSHWFSFGWYAWDPSSADRVSKGLARVLFFLENPDARTAALQAEDAADAYLSHWCVAFTDGRAALQSARKLLQSPSPELRLAGARLSTQLGLDGALDAILPMLEDPELRVALIALNLVNVPGNSLKETELFERVEKLLKRLPEKPTTYPATDWPWEHVEANAQKVCGMLPDHLGSRPPGRLLPHLAGMDSDGRAKVVNALARLQELDADGRSILLQLVGDASPYVRQPAQQLLLEGTVTSEDAVQLESLLHRKVDDLRQGVVALLMKQADADVLDSAGRLLASADDMRQRAGLSLLQQLIGAGRSAAASRKLGQSYLARKGAASDLARDVLDAIRGPREQALSLESGLGLYDPAERTGPATPRIDCCAERSLATPAAVACIESLDRLIGEHREVQVTLPGQANPGKPLGNYMSGFNMGRPVSADTWGLQFPLAGLWETWCDGRPANLRDGDGLELVRALACLRRASPYVAGGTMYTEHEKSSEWQKRADRLLFERCPRTNYAGVANCVLFWLVTGHPPGGAADLILDGVETTFALIPASELSREPGFAETSWRDRSSELAWLHLARIFCRCAKSEWHARHTARLYGLLRWMDEPGPPVSRFLPELHETLAAHEVGGATEADIFDHLVGPGRSNFRDLRIVSARKPPAWTHQYPALAELVKRCRERIIDTELGRGEMPTAVSQAAAALTHVGGLDMLVRLLAALGSESLLRDEYVDYKSRRSLFSNLVRRTAPAETDTTAQFCARVRETGLSETKLLELAMFAPQWARHVEAALGWAGLADGAWWFHAHTAYGEWYGDSETREARAADISERTPLAHAELLEGAVDVDWFFRAHAALGSVRWKALETAAKRMVSAEGQKRAKLFAGAMSGTVTEQDLMTRISATRNRDAVRALGLVPLPESAASTEPRQTALLGRYRVFQEFLRAGKQFGSQRQISEKLAVTMGMENLARTAGYADPMRLQWAMEAREIQDLAEGPVTATLGDVAVSLSINGWGEPELGATRAGKVLQSIPAAVKQDPVVVALQERRKAIQQQAARMRRSLEEAMCRGDLFAAGELRTLFAHPVLVPMLRLLCFIVEGTAIIGFPVHDGEALESHDGAVSPVSAGSSVRIAHPFDLLGSGNWPHWQKHCFLHERIQPFKQIFRELYVLTSGERAGGAVSQRYAGHLIKPQQALALFNTRGWVTRPDEGLRRSFHEARISVWLPVEIRFGSTDSDGMTLDGVGFYRDGESAPMELESVPPRIFSEAMRDLDLVVSVAHLSGVDAEASSSTVEMRASLVEETCGLLKLTNVRIQGTHVLIEGSLSSYNVHLGSGVVHRQPGGALCIVPVQAEARGRIFLPFADNDPKTAEVLSKVVMLARDSKIKDPTILEQILR